MFQGFIVDIFHWLTLFIINTLYSGYYYYPITDEETSPERLSNLPKIVTKTQVWLPATMKAKLVRQVLVQKGTGLFRFCDLGEW